MKKFLLDYVVKLAFVASVILGFQLVMAHPGGHGRPVSPAQAQAMALKIVKTFSHRDVKMGFGKLPESWSSLPAEAAKIHKIGDTYYIVAVTNPENEKTLFVLMSESGDVYDANFTGDFATVKE